MAHAASITGSGSFHSRPAAVRVLLTLLACISIPVACSGAEVKIIADRVNLRAGPSEQAEVVAQVSKGQTVVVQGSLENDWVSVVPPASVSLWVYGDLVKDGIVAAAKAQVRAGPGISYRIVGAIQKGQPVTVRETTEDWLKIVPPPGCVLWINRKFLESAGAMKEADMQSPKAIPEAGVAPIPSKPQTEPRVVSTNAAEVVRHDAPVTKSRPPQPNIAATVPASKSSSENYTLDESDLIGGMEQGKHVEYEGTLNYSSFVLKRPSKYILIVVDEKGHILDSCYVLGREAEFEALVGRQVSVSGKQYWLQGVRYSVIAQDHIALAQHH